MNQNQTKLKKLYIMFWDFSFNLLSFLIEETFITSMSFDAIIAVNLIPNNALRVRKNFEFVIVTSIFKNSGCWQNHRSELFSYFKQKLGLP